MGATKSETFTDTQVQLAEWAKALAHPARIAILEVLIKRGTCICGDIVDELPLAQATISQHLKVMKEAGLIQGNVEGRAVCYCVDPRVCEQAGLAIGLLLEQAKCCCPGC